MKIMLIWLIGVVGISMFVFLGDATINNGSYKEQYGDPGLIGEVVFYSMILGLAIFIYKTCKGKKNKDKIPI